LGSAATLKSSRPLTLLHAASTTASAPKARREAMALIHLSYLATQDDAVQSAESSQREQHDAGQAAEADRIRVLAELLQQAGASKLRCDARHALRARFQPGEIGGSAIGCAT
jgi:hypothetical protein